jgi:2'-5' RNA ligase
MRIFIALDIEDSIRERIARFVEGVHGFAPDARWVRPESMHVTLKFIGEKSELAVGEIKQALETIDSGSVEIRFRGYGFFPTAKAFRVFWIGIEAGPQLASLASAIDERMASLGIPKEEHAFSPHLTLARRGDGSASPRVRNEDGGNSGFQRLQEKLSAMPAPEFGTMTAREFILYKSQLSQGGSRYTKLAAFNLR